MPVLLRNLSDDRKGGRQASKLGEKKCQKVAGLPFRRAEERGDPASQSPGWLMVNSRVMSRKPQAARRAVMLR